MKHRNKILFLTNKISEYNNYLREHLKQYNRSFLIPAYNEEQISGLNGFNCDGYIIGKDFYFNKNSEKMLIILKIHNIEELPY